MHYSTAQMFKSAVQDPLSFAPGERYQYSDVGYFLLGMILEKVSGRRYSDFLNERFFQPLGMTATSVIDQWAIVKNRAAGYTLRDGRLARIRRDSQVELPSHFGVLSSVRDLLRWDAALASGKAVKPASLQLMWTPVKLNDGSTHPYGFGWAVDERRGHRRISHTGITGTEYSRYPDDGLVVIVLTNLGAQVGGPTGINSWGLTHGVAGRYIEGLLISMIPVEPDREPQLSQRLREMLASLAQGADTPIVGAKLKSLIGPATHKIVAERLSALKSFTFISCDETGARAMEHLGERVSRVCYYKMLTGAETRYYTFWLTGDGRVADFNSALE
jgi:CubicO group peptidase (beta-lactamase class C family)